MSDLRSQTDPPHTVGFETASTDELPLTRIQASSGWAALKLGDFWAYRELLYFLIWRDIKVRYKQTALGASWAVLQPVLTMLIFSLIFNRVANISSQGLPYPVFAFAALIPWTFFANGVQFSSTSLVQSSSLLTKVYFPRLIVPAAAVLSGILDFALSSVVLIGLMLYYGITPTHNIVWVPMFLALALITALAVGIFLSAMNVRYRDVRYTMSFLLQTWLLATPVAYSIQGFKQPWRTLLGLNPMTGVVEGFRWAVLGTSPRPGGVILVSATVAVVGLFVAISYFKRMERTFADVV